jgi:hypothetical protein
MIGKRILMGAMAIGMGMTMAACSMDIERNDDGSLTVTSVMPEASVQEELATARNTEDHTVTADLREGYFFVTVEGDFPRLGESGTLTFWATPSVADGHLAITISEAQLNGEAFDAGRVAQWNERLANRLERAAGRRPNRALQSVTVTDDSLTMVWRVETPRSRNSD